MTLSEIAVLLGLNLALIVAVMLGLWGLSLRLRDVSFVDAAWPLGMLMLALATFARTDGDPMRKGLLVWLCGVWALWLGWRLWRRWRAQEAGGRYVGVIESRQRDKGWSFGRTGLVFVFLPQAVLAWLVALPVQLGQVAFAPALGWIGWAGAVLAVIGMGFESIGDAQLQAFRREPKNRRRVLDSGLWRYTRHPNYFGEACVWWGLYLIAAETGPGLWAVPGPVFLTFTLVRWSRMGGAGKTIAKSRPGYAAYVQRTSAFFPWPPKKSGRGSKENPRRDATGADRF
jgi:steroid 5-alpha reductase family enzyme